MLKQEYQALEQKRIWWLVGLGLALAMEAGGALLILRGLRTAGMIVAVAGLAIWLVLRYIGNNAYTRGCATLRLRYGLPLKEGKEADDKAMRDTLPCRELLPAGASGETRPLLMHTHQGRWHGFPATVTEMTIGFLPDTGARREYMTGTLLVVEAACTAPGLLALYGQPYGGVPVSRWADMTAVDTGERGLLLLSQGQTEADEHLLDAFSAFDGKHEKMVVVRTEKDRILVFLPGQYYSGNWTLSRPMPEQAVENQPLPALEGLPKLIRALTN